MKKIMVVLLMLFSIVSYSVENNKFLKVEKKDYPNAHYVLVDENSIVKYQSDGKSLKTEDMLIKILDEKGKNENENVVLNYDSNYEKLLLKEAYLIKKDGKKLEINISKNSKIQISPESAQSNIYDKSQKLLILKIPNLEVGDYLYYKVEHNNFKTMIKDNFSDFYLLRNEYPIIKAKYKIIAPKEKDLKYSVVLNGLKDKYKLTKKSNDKNIIYELEEKNIPQIIPEPSMPSITQVAMKWIVTTNSSWEEISKWYFNLSEPKIIIDESIRKKAESLVLNSKTDMEKIKNIFFFVSRKIRYMGITNEKNRPGLEPNSTDLTLKEMTGVCRDKAALIVAMLRSQGFEANMVLVKVGDKLDKEVPIPYFNHAIATVKLNGKYILMDPTDETTKKLFPDYEMDKSYLIAKKYGDLLKTTPVIEAVKNKLKIVTNIKNINGEFQCKTNIEFLGINDGAYRGYFARLNKDEKDKFIKRVLNILSKTAKLEKYELLPNNLLRDSSTLKLSVEYKISDYIISGNEYSMIKLPKFSRILGLYNWALGDVKLPMRKYPLKNRFTASISEKIIYNSENKNFVIKFVPSTMDINENGHTFYSKYITDKGKIISYKYMTLDKLEYSTKEYLKLKEYLKEEESYNKKYIIIKNFLKK
ncbi:DUF3857 domain-containing transglutaminase family protein [Haliovirga abyssi]|uniref:DUF3857 domain-containing protein n=1 Tax=Haliovirga abyssi TaxID=2996794 RepID=A0AAU9DFK2_9FUSO|nr:DUF3857 and transglutaminase domain-containing protein [Haliovirga abyssi]BDU51197.1 hypothetical protein HLVA_17660 [Haliovirga abyssi]